MKVVQHMEEVVPNEVIETRRTPHRYVRKCVYWQGQRWWLISDRFNKREFHTHVPFEKKNAAIMIMKMAEKGEITKDYPDWMIESINRLWFGKDFRNDPKMNNDNLLVNDPEVRIKFKKKKHHNKYRNSSKNYRKR